MGADKRNILGIKRLATAQNITCGMAETIAVYRRDRHQAAAERSALCQAGGERLIDVAPAPRSMAEAIENSGGTNETCSARGRGAAGVRHHRSERERQSAGAAYRRPLGSGVASKAATRDIA